MATPTLEVLSVADKAIRLRVQFADLPANNNIVAAYILIADNGIGIKKMLVEDIAETDLSPADLRLTKLRNKEAVEFVVDHLENGVKYGLKPEIMYRTNSDVFAPVVIARSVFSVYATPAGKSVAPVIQLIKAVDETSFNITMENPIFANPSNDGGSKISKLIIYLSRGRDEKDAEHPIVNDVICQDFDVTFYVKNANGELDASKVLLVTGLIAGEQYEMTAAYVNSVGTGLFSNSSRLVSGTNKFGPIKNVEASGNDGSGTFSFIRPDNFMIDNLVGAVLENVVDPASGKVAVAALYYKFNGTGFDLLTNKDGLTGTGFPFKKDPLYRYSIVVNGIPNNESLKYMIRLINNYSEGDNLPNPLSIIAPARPGPLRSVKLVEAVLSNDSNWVSAFNAQKMKVDPRFSTLRSGAIQCIAPATNWPKTDGKIRVIQTIYDSITTAEDTAIKYFLSDALSGVVAVPSEGIDAWEPVQDRNDTEKGLSETQIRSSIQHVASSLNQTQWTAKTAAEKLVLASNLPKLVSAISMYYTILAVSKDLQTLANTETGYQEITDEQMDDDYIFDSRSLIKLFFLAGSTPTISLTARLIDQATGTLLVSDPSVISRRISSSPSSVVGQGVFVAESNDIKFKMLEFRCDQGLNLGQGKMTLSLLNAGDAIVSTQTRLFTFDKSVTGAISRKIYSLASDFGFIINNASKYSAKFELAIDVIDTLAEVSVTATGAKVENNNLRPKGKAASPNAIFRTNYDGSVSAKFTSLDADALAGTNFSKYSTYLVPRSTASNATLKGYTQNELAIAVVTYVIKQDLSSNVNNPISGFIQTDAARLAKQDFSWSYTSFPQGTLFTPIYATMTDSDASNSNYVVGEELQTFATPTDPRTVVAVASGKSLSIQATWGLPTKDGRGKPDGSNLQNFMVRLYSSANTFSGSQLAEVSVAGSATSYSFTNAADSANNQLVISGSYVISVQAVSKDLDGEAKPLKTPEVLSNQVTISTTPVLSSAYVSGNQVLVSWTPNGTTADKIFYAFAVQDFNGNIVDGEFMGTTTASSVSQSSITLTYTPAQTGYTLVANGIVVLTTGQGQVAYTSTPLNAPASN